MIGCIISGVYAVRVLPWWALVLGLIGLVLVAKWAIKHLIRKLFLVPFKAKGAVLKGATATIHSVALAESPGPVSDPEPADEESTTTRNSREHYVVDVTITPQESKGPFQHWAPSELTLVKPDSVLRPESDEPDDSDESCELLSVEALEDGKWVKDEGMKYAGPQRLRMSLGVQPGVDRLKFRYYFEEFGEVSFSEASAKVAACV